MTSITNSGHIPGSVHDDLVYVGLIGDFVCSRRVCDDEDEDFDEDQTAETGPMFELD